MNTNQGHLNDSHFTYALTNSEMGLTFLIVLALAAVIAITVALVARNA